MIDFSDQHFLKRLNSGDEQAFLKVYDFFMPKIYRFLYYQARQHKELAEDLAQHVFIKTWEYIGRDQNNIEHIQAFLYRIARNLMVDHWRAQHNKETVELSEDVTDTQDHELTLIDKIDMALTIDLIKQKLNSIPEQYREIIIMRFIEELTIEEIAEALQKDKNNIYVLIHRALKALRTAISSND